MWYTKRDNEQKRVKEKYNDKRTKKVLLWSLYTDVFTDVYRGISAIFYRRKKLCMGSRSRRRIKPAFFSISILWGSTKRIFP